MAQAQTDDVSNGNGASLVHLSDLLLVFTAQPPGFNH